MSTITKLKTSESKGIEAGKVYFANFDHKDFKIHLAYTTPNYRDNEEANAYLRMSINGINFRSGRSDGTRFSSERLSEELDGVVKEWENGSTDLNEDQLSIIVKFFLNKHEWLRDNDGDPDSQTRKIKILTNVINHMNHDS